MFAHYFASKTRKYVVISRDPSIQLENRVAEFPVSGKREARQIAARYSARCWNF